MTASRAECLTAAAALDGALQLIDHEESAQTLSRVADQWRDEAHKAEPHIGYDRQVLVDVLIYHYRRDIKGCGCGWAELGRSWPEHVATVYEESIAARGTTCSTCGGNFDDPPCSRNPATGRSGHTVAGGVGAQVTEDPRG